MSEVDGLRALNAQMAETAARQAALREERRRRLVAEYGPDRWQRGTVLIFRPHPDEKDQETRAAVKIGTATWTLTARGGRHSWEEVLEFAGSGHVLNVVDGEKGTSFIAGVAAVISVAPEQP